MLLFVRVALAGIFWRSGRTKVEEGSWLTVGENTSAVDIPANGVGITYSVTVTASATDRLLRVRAIRLVAALSAAMICGPADAQDPAGGWTLRAAPGADQIAVSIGPGAIRDVMVFCLSGAPFMALRLADPGETASIEVGFAFSDGDITVPAGREDGLDGAYVIDLAAHPVAPRLAGRDSRVDISLDGAAQGVLSLSGSSRAIPGALAGCHDF